MTNFAALARELTSLLGLDRPPVALAPADAAPAGVAACAERSPSACAFWTRAERETFFASAADHMSCPVGAMVSGFALTPAAERELQEGVALMCQVGYLDPAEAARIPALPRAGNGKVYGPLATFPLPPQLILLWLRPAQAMILREATGEAQWKGEPSAGLFGRPGCAALAVAAGRNGPALSLGCTGMRLFTGVEEDRLLAAIPGTRLEELMGALRKIVAANRAMRGAYEGKLAAFAARP